MIDKNCLSYWFPPIRDAGLPVPRTEIVQTDMDLILLIDGARLRGLQRFIDRLAVAVVLIGGCPCFLRTGHGSGKHGWQETCYLDNPAHLHQHVYQLVEWSNTVDVLGLPTATWAVRRLIPTRALFHAFSGQMPIVREFRVFTRNGFVTCIHPYWPVDSIRDPDCEDWQERLAWEATYSEAEARIFRSIAGDAAKALPDDDWSVDVLQDRDGNWWLTDMALAARSWHWPGCEYGPNGS